MSIIIRLSITVALSIFFSATVSAQQLQQPSSLLPLGRLQPSPPPRQLLRSDGEIVAPPVVATPQWLLKAADSLERKSGKTSRAALTKSWQAAVRSDETKGPTMLGDIRAGVRGRTDIRPTKKHRTRVSPSNRSEEGPELRFYGTRRAQKQRSTKRLK